MNLKNKTKVKRIFFFFIFVPYTAALARGTDKEFQIERNKLHNLKKVNIFLFQSHHLVEDVIGYLGVKFGL